MSLDLDKIKNKLAALNKTDQKKANFWKPEPGAPTQIRIVPYSHRKENPFLEMYFYYDLAKRTVVSPKSFGDNDPVVEFAEKMKNTGDKDDWTMGRKMEPKMRTYVPIIVRGKESEGVKFWGFGITIYKELMSYMADPDYGDITDLMNGRDIAVEYIPAEAGGYPKTNIRIKPATSPATTDKAIAKLIMDQDSAETMWVAPSYEELETMLEEYLNPESETSDVATDTSAAPSPKSEKQTKLAEATNTDVDAAFDELFK